MAIAKELQYRTGKPVIIPVRLNYSASMPYELYHRLMDIIYLEWHGDSDTANLANNLRAAMSE